MAQKPTWGVLRSTAITWLTILKRICEKLHEGDFEAADTAYSELDESVTSGGENFISMSQFLSKQLKPDKQLVTCLGAVMMNAMFVFEELNHLGQSKTKAVNTWRLNLEQFMELTDDLVKGEAESN